MARRPKRWREVVAGSGDDDLSAMARLMEADLNTDKKMHGWWKIRASCELIIITRPVGYTGYKNIITFIT